MKELKVLDGFEKLKDKKILLYDVVFDTFITYDKEILMFEQMYDSECDSIYIEYKSEAEINDNIVRREKFRKLLISNEVIDEEYYQELLKGIEYQKILK